MGFELAGNEGHICGSNGHCPHNFECQLNLLDPHLNTADLMVEEYGLYLGSCRMNSEGVYER